MAKLEASYPFFLANRPVAPNQDLEVRDKYTGDVATRVALADEATIDHAIGKAVEAARPMAALHAYERQAVLQHCVDRFKRRSEELAMALCIEAGKPIRDSRGEVTRLIDTFRIAAEESVRIEGAVMPLDISARAKDYSGMWKRVPLGSCSFISPFNFPLNLAAHKVAPAIAAGCPFVLKPASLTPIGALLIGEVLAETDLPPGAFSILPCRRDGARLFSEDDRLKLLSFTGSPPVGWDLKARAGKKKVVLELGGNAGVIVDKSADLDWAVKRTLVGAFSYAGQVCISVQRMFVHADIWDAFMAKFVEGAKALKVGDPLDATTDVGPMVDANAASRTQRWVDEALALGGKALLGGRAQGTFFPPTILTDVPIHAQVCSNEAFAPLVVAFPFTDIGDAIRQVNDSFFGLQTGVFTNDLGAAWSAFGELEVGGVIVNDVPTYRIDHMPYGGVKDSGLGREGLRWAIEDMTEVRIMVLAQPS